MSNDIWNKSKTHQKRRDIIRNASALNWEHLQNNRQKNMNTHIKLDQITPYIENSKTHIGKMDTEEISLNISSTENIKDNTYINDPTVLQPEIIWQIGSAIPSTLIKNNKGQFWVWAISNGNIYLNVFPKSGVAIFLFYCRHIDNDITLRLKFNEKYVRFDNDIIMIDQNFGNGWVVIEKKIYRSTISAKMPIIPTTIQIINHKSNYSALDDNIFFYKMVIMPDK